ncbi:MAG: oligosaccharide flippase family protein, partial [Actinomycetota bacterium]|nr:oligosaccharide flippase family protein [Actinomycetota bacterium]
MSELPADGASSAPHPGPGFGARAARGFLWTMGAFGANRLLVFASTLVLARLLAPEDFGIVAAGLTLVLYLEVALDLGLGAAVVYEQETGISRRVQTAFTVTITVATALTVLGMVLAPLLADFFRASNETTLFRAIFLSILLRGAGQVPDALLRRDLRFVARSATDTARGVVRLGVTVGLAFAGAGPWAIVGGLLASDVTGTTLVWALARFRPTFTLD